MPPPLIMFACTALRHALLEWQTTKGVHPQASKSKVKADRPDHSNHFNYLNDSGKNASCCTTTGRKLLTLPGVADPYTFSMNTWITLPESYHQMVYTNTLATVKREIQQAENPMPAVVIGMEAARVDNAILLDHWTSEVAVEEPDIGSNDPNIPTDNNCTDDTLHFWVAGGRRDYYDEGGESDKCDDIPTASRRQQPATKLGRFDLGTTDVDGYEREDGNAADAEVYEEEDASQANDGSTQNVQD